MTKLDFKNEDFGYPEMGDRGFMSGSFFGRKYENIDYRLVQLKRCFELEIFKNGEIVKDNWKNPKNILIKLWKKSKNVNEFKKLIREDEKAKLMQFTAILLKNDWYFLRSILGDRKFNTYADAGSVKVGNENLSFLISSGGGDGKVRCGIFNSEKEFNSSAFNFITSITGNFNIYTYDCGNEVARVLDGRYGVYSKDGFVCFVKWEN